MDSESRAELTRLLQGLQRGDRRAFRPVFDRLWPVLLSFSRRLGLAPVDCEDTAQRALMRIFGRIHEFKPQHDGLSWALAITVFEVRTARKKVQRRREVPDTTLESLPSDDVDDANERERRDLWAALERALPALGDLDRELILSSLEHRDVERVATPAERKRRQRAIERLRHAILRLSS